MKSWGIEELSKGGYGSRSKKKNLVPPYCELCGYSYVVTKHRIKPGIEGGKYIPGNVIGLCPNCHAMADRGLIPRRFLFSIVFERLRDENGIKGHHRKCIVCLSPIHIGNDPICVRCETGLGYFKYDSGLLRLAASYLDE